MVEEANQSGYWNSCKVIAIAFMYRLLKYSNQRNNILGGQVLSQDAGKSRQSEILKWRHDWQSRCDMCGKQVWLTALTRFSNHIMHIICFLFMLLFTSRYCRS